MSCCANAIYVIEFCGAGRRRRGRRDGGEFLSGPVSKEDLDNVWEGLDGDLILGGGCTVVHAISAMRDASRGVVTVDVCIGRPMMII